MPPFQIPDVIVPARFPGLRGLAWNRDPDRPLPAEDAFTLYERQWRHVDVAALTDDERALIAALGEKFGHGVMLT